MIYTYIFYKDIYYNTGKNEVKKFFIIRENNKPFLEIFINNQHETILRFEVDGVVYDKKRKTNNKASNDLYSLFIYYINDLKKEEFATSEFKEKINNLLYTLQNEESKNYKKTLKTFKKLSEGDIVYKKVLLFKEEDDLFIQSVFTDIDKKPLTISFDDNNESFKENDFNEKIKLLFNLNYDYIYSFIKNYNKKDNILTNIHNVLDDNIVEHQILLNDILKKI